MAFPKVLIVNQPLYITTILTIKVSILLMYYRIFPVRSMKIAAYVMSIITVLWWIPLMILTQTHCLPYEKLYKPWVPGHCVNEQALIFALSITSIITDIIILSLPIPHVWRLHTTRTQKISLIVIFLLGSFVVFTSIYRFTRFIDFTPKDYSYTIAPGMAWNNVELGSGIISACFPTLGPILKKVLSRLVPATFGSKSSKGSSSSTPKRPTIVTIGGSGAKSNPNSTTRSWTKLSDFSKYDAMTTESHEDKPYHDGSGDETPLRIMKRYEVTCTEERLQQSRGDAKVPLPEPINLLGKIREKPRDGPRAEDDVLTGSVGSMTAFAARAVTSGGYTRAMKMKIMTGADMI
ncbi:putative integral membrane protein [Diplocarpon rosae]|nr:putative integral membrane protein [Diplocarpon rosae]